MLISQECYVLISQECYVLISQECPNWNVPYASHASLLVLVLSSMSIARSVLRLRLKMKIWRLS